MIDGHKTSKLVSPAKKRVDIRNISRTNAKIQGSHGTKQIRMTVEGRHLSSRNHQQAIEVRLQLSHRIILRSRVVVRDRNKVQSPARRRLSNHKNRTRHLHAANAVA